MTGRPADRDRCRAPACLSATRSIPPSALYGRKQRLVTIPMRLSYWPSARTVPGSRSYAGRGGRATLRLRCIVRTRMGVDLMDPDSATLPSCRHAPAVPTYTT